MKKKFTLLATGLFLGMMSLKAQTTCSPDRIAYVDSKNTGLTGAYTLAIGQEEKAAQTYHYSGPGKVSGARIYGDVVNGLAVKLRVSLYEVDANGRPTGSALATAPLESVYAWDPAYFDVSFSPAVSVNENFAVVVEVVHFPGWGHEYELRYTGNGEGLGEDLASLAGTSTGHNWASAMSAFGKDGDMYIYPKMVNVNAPRFSMDSRCLAVGQTVSFYNSTQMTTDEMFNQIAAPGYAGSNFLYTWDFGDGSPVSHDVNPSHSYSVAGMYTITLSSTIEGWDGVCTKTYSKTVSVGLGVSTASTVNVACNGDNSGSAVLAGSGGAAPYFYSLNNGVSQTGSNYSSLIAGVYNVTLTDALNCTATTSFTISEPAAITFTTASSTNASCGSSNGSILVATTGGVGAMQYRIGTGSYQSSGSFTGLAAGGYTITAKDANGCTKSTTVMVNDFGGPEFNIVNATQVSCNGGNDASISLTSLGGTGAIQYSINGGLNYQSTGNFNSLSAGTYIVMVKDAAGCTDVEEVTISEPQTLSFTATTTPLTCFGSQDGEINVEAVTGGTGNIVYSINGTTYQSGTNFPGLAAGNYTVYAKDITGCVSSMGVTISQPTLLTATVNVTAAGCNGSQDGEIEVIGAGGTPGYIYGINDDELMQSSGIFDELGAGTYELLVEDDNGCQTEISATIAEPSVVIPVATTTNSTCGNANGGVLVTATGGSGSGYTYSINGGAFGAGSFSALAAGTYIVTAKDGAGCISSINVTINDSNGPSIVTSSSTNVNCHGGNDGTITIGSVTGGTGTLQYSINGVTYQTSPVFTGLPAGTYDVTVKDAVGCIGSETITITEPNAFVITSTVEDAVCNGSATGEITFLVGGGAGTLAYSLDGNNFQSGNTFTNLQAGVYMLTVKDAGGCYGYAWAAIDEPTPIVVNTTSLNVTCYGADNGALYVYASGGTGALEYSIDGTNYQGTNVFMNLSGGPVIVMVKDDNGCIETVLAHVYEPLPLTLTANVTNVACAGGDNGVIDLSVSGGNTHYNFVWSNGSTNEDIFNLEAGTYSVDVTDANACNASLTLSVTEPLLPVIVNGTVVNSNGSANGSIELTVTGGAGNYTYQWSNGMSTEDVTGLLPGAYTVVVTDGEGCATSSTFIVSNLSGVNNITGEAGEVLIYPNPANDVMFVEANGESIEQCKVFSVLGQLVFQTNPNSTRAQITTNELKPGAYFIQITTNGNQVTKKFEVVR